jgi:hypothetical protein
MIRGLKRILGFFVIAVGLFTSACSSRVSEPVILADSTVVYPPNEAEDISAKITFSRYLSQKSERQSAISTVFPLKEDGNVFAVISLENRLKQTDRELLFHIDWIDPENNSFYKKQINLVPGDSTTSLISSISVSPDKRSVGKFMVRIYLFRELIAEKYFELRDSMQLEKVSGNIVFFKSIDKESGEMKGIDTVFEIKKKGILRAQINLHNLTIYKDVELPIRLEWISPDGESFYSKKIDVKPSDSVRTLTGSISITPDKRAPGVYFLRAYLYEEMIAERKFELFAESKGKHSKDD